MPLDLPYVLIQEIAHHLDDETLVAFERVDKKIGKIINCNMFYKKKCSSFRFQLNINPIYTTDETISWKNKYILSKYFPTVMHYKKEKNIIETGLVVENPFFGRKFNIKSVEPFITCNEKFKNMDFFKKGLEYFEILLLKNTLSFNTSTVIGLSSQLIKKQQYLGWAINSIGFHSDDGTIQDGDNDLVDMNIVASNDKWIYTTGDTVGVGIDWDRKLVFVTRNGILLYSTNIVKDYTLYPSVTIGHPSNSVQINFGDKPFMFNISDFALNPENYFSPSTI